MKNLLINREWDIQGNWYSPKYFLNNFKSVHSVNLINTCSSAGDWEGILYQIINGTLYAIPFSQENNYPHSGYTLYTGEVFAKIKVNDETGVNTQSAIDEIEAMYCEQVYAFTYSLTN